MPAKKGQVLNPNGRPKGAQNKSTGYAREAIAKFVEGNVGRLNKWLDKIAEDSPEKAFNCFMSVVEYHIPKLQRAELTGKDGEELSLVKLIESTIVKPTISLNAAPPALENNTAVVIDQKQNEATTEHSSAPIVDATKPEEEDAEIHSEI